MTTKLICYETNFGPKRTFDGLTDLSSISPNIINLPHVYITLAG